MLKLTIGLFCGSMLCATALPVYSFDFLTQKDWLNTQTNLDNQHKTFLKAHDTQCKFDGQPTTLTLAETIDRALCFNPETHQYWAKTKAAAASLGITKSKYLPTINATIQYTNSETRFQGFPEPINSHVYSGNLNLNWMLYDFGRTEASVKQAEALIQTNQALQEVTIQKTLLEASERYFSALYSNAMLMAQQKNESLAKESLAIVEGQFSGGAVSLIDVLQVRDLASKATLERKQAESELREQQGLLASLIELPIEQPLKLPNPKEFLVVDQHPLKPFQDLSKHALSTHPELIRIRSEITQLEQKQLRIEKQYLPTINASAQVLTSPDAKSSLAQAEHYSEVGIQVTIPIFQGFSVNYQVEQVRQELEEKHYQLEQAQKLIERQMWQAYSNWFNTFEQIKDAQKLINSAEQTQQITMDRYRQGVGEILEWLMAQGNLAKARLDYVKLLNSQRISRLQLASTMGNGALYQLISDPKIDSGAMNLQPQ